MPVIYFRFFPFSLPDFPFERTKLGSNFLSLENLFLRLPVVLKKAFESGNFGSLLARMEQSEIRRAKVIIF